MLRQVIKKKKEAYLCAKQTAEVRIRYDFIACLEVDGAGSFHLHTTVPDGNIRDPSHYTVFIFSHNN